MAQNLPDGEILARTWALSKTSITDLVNQKVSTRLPVGAEMPFVVIQMLGGSPLGGESLIYQAQLVEDFYAGKYATNSTKGQPDYSSAFSLGNTFVREAFDHAPTKLTSVGGEVGMVHGFDSISGLGRVEEPELGLARYTCDMVMIYGAIS